MKGGMLASPECQGAYDQLPQSPLDMGARKIVGGYHTLPEVNVMDRVTAQSRAYGNKWLDTLIVLLWKIPVIAG